MCAGGSLPQFTWSEISVTSLILASSSPFRQQLLTAAGIPFTAIKPQVDESQIMAQQPRDLALARAAAKAEAIAPTQPGDLVLGCDQVLSCDGQAFDKVNSAAEARARLLYLAGQTHYLHSAWCLARASDDGRVEWLSRECLDIKMPMRPLSDAEIDAYVATDEWQGSVGCYQYENRGVQLVEEVAADGSAIVCLPLGPLGRDLRRLGFNPLLQNGQAGA